MPDTAPMTLVDQLRSAMPVAMASLQIAGRGTGLVIVDEVNGFASVGYGNLAPPAPNPQVSAMVTETDRLARAFADNGWPILALLDTHEPGKPEPPYPPHCERGTGEENLVPELEWLETNQTATLVDEDIGRRYCKGRSRSVRNQNWGILRSKRRRSSIL